MTRCPILSKLQQAAAIISKGQAHSPAALAPTSVLLEGSNGSYVHVDYDPGAAGIILNFVLNGTNELVEQMAKHTSRDVPTWAPNKDVKCHAKLLEAFNSFVSPSGMTQPSLLETMLFLSKGLMPRRVTCTGYSLGGSLASLAACWASYTLATADVRCITFGALRVGNIDFRSAFENMVGTKYRVVFQHDPVPHALDKRLLYAHAGSVIWISDGKLCWKEPLSHKGSKNLDDHKLEHYLSALSALAGSTTTGLPGDTERQITFSTMGHEAVDATRDAKSTVKDAMKGMLPHPGSVRTHGLHGRCVDDFELKGAEKGVAKAILAGKVAQAILLAKHAYDTEDKFRKETGLTKFRLIEYKPEDAQVYVIWLDGGTVVFAFRGTESTKDAQTDADARLKPIPWLEGTFPGCKGHVGFMRQFESVTDPAHPERHIGLVLEDLSNRCEPTRVLCCGHSLGGALATLGAMWASYEFPDADIRCITLGSPRVGSFNFSHAAKYLVGCTHRLVHGWDPVPTVPPPGVGFKHVKGRMFLHNNMCKLKKRPWYMSYGLLVGKVGDHFIGPYAAHVAHITGLEIMAEKLGLVRMDTGGTLTEAKAAQDDHDGDGVPSAAPMPEKGSHTAPGAPAGMHVPAATTADDRPTGNGEGGLVDG